MTAPLPPAARRPLRRRSGRRALLGAIAATAVAFALGLALGQSLDDNPDPAQTQTLVRTLRPLPIAPAARETVTITTSNP